MTTDTPVREPFDVGDLDALDDMISTRIQQHFSAGEPTKATAMKIALQTKSTLMHCLGKVKAERDAALARLALAEKVVEALKSLLSEENVDLDDLAHFSAYFIMKDTLAAYDAAKDGTEGAECDTKG
jgi:hypothetical protein